uniref:hypothetical protein n=1 Tax=uncultured Rhizobium sp. TaxID=155567 RepID=UPI002603CAA3|nr:hypothetical protein [uncultured Rhizobium sp.]
MNGFSLIETMRFEPGQGIVRQRLHMARLANSARKLGFTGVRAGSPGRQAVHTGRTEPRPAGTVW